MSGTSERASERARERERDLDEASSVGDEKEAVGLIDLKGAYPDPHGGETPPRPPFHFRSRPAHCPYSTPCWRLCVCVCCVLQKGGGGGDLSAAVRKGKGGKEAPAQAGLRMGHASCKLCIQGLTSCIQGSCHCVICPVRVSAWPCRLQMIAWPCRVSACPCRLQMHLRCTAALPSCHTII